MTYLELMQNLQMYDKMMEIDSSIQEMVRKKKEEEILQYIHTIHSRSVSQMSTGRYAGCWQTRLGKGRDGSKYVRAKTLIELLNIIATFYGLNPKIFKQWKTPLFSEYFPTWLKWKTQRNDNKAGTLARNNGDYKRFVQGTNLDNLHLEEFTTDILDEWARDTLRKTPMTAKRFNTLKIVITGPLDLAVREKYIASTPWKPELMDYKLLLKSERRAPSKDKIFYDDEITDIISICAEDYNETGNSSDIMIIINFDLGLRAGELAALRWEDVDWHNNTISIQRQESEGKIEEYVKSDSAAGYRELPINSNVVRLLKSLQCDQGSLSGYIFLNRDGTRKTSAAYKDRLVYIQGGKNYKKEGKTVKRSHCQRRTVGTRIAKERGLEAARQWLGHTDIQTTLKYIYTTETIDSMREFSEESSLIKGIKTTKAKVIQAIYKEDSN